MIDAGMAQSVEHVIGNDEVTSSNLVTSSRKGTSAKQMCLFWSCQLLTEMYHTKCEAFFVLSSNLVFFITFRHQLRKVTKGSRQMGKVFKISDLK